MNFFPVELRSRQEPKTKNVLLSGNILVSSNERNPSVALSQSVQITKLPETQRLLISPLEKEFRARYKSDYFPSSGSPRSPRYVADERGNHRISVQVQITTRFFDEFRKIVFYHSDSNGIPCEQKQSLYEGFVDHNIDPRTRAFLQSVQVPASQ